MLEISPESLVFHDVRINNAYLNSLCITNPLQASVEFTLRPSSPRYTLTPNRINLSAGQSIVVTVRLFLSHYPNSFKGTRGQEDCIIIKSSYFEQKVSLTFFLHNRDSSSLSRSRSYSPLGKSEISQYTPDNVRKSVPAPSSHGNDLIETLNNVIKAKDVKITQLNETIGFLEAKYPNWQQIIKNRIDQERNTFEEKSDKVLQILRRKDSVIADLQQQLEILSSEYQALSDANKSLVAQAKDSAGKSRDYWQFNFF